METTEAAVKRYEADDYGEGTKRVTVLHPGPDSPPDFPFVGNQALIRNCLAAWLGGLNWRTESPPGLGKNHLVYSLVKHHLPRPTKLFVMQGHADLEPQDLVCTPRLTDFSEGRYVASPLVAAMRCGGVFFLDEIGKLSERALSVLVSVLDERRSISSVLAGFSLTAHPDFRFCAAMNPSDPPLPDYIEKRLRPRFKLDYPSATDLTAILRARFPGGQAALLEAAFTDWLADKDHVAPRDAITMIEFARAMARERQLTLRALPEAEDLIEEAANCVLVR